MSKGIFLYSEDKKYKCAFELCDTLDKYQIPDHSVMILFEEREDGNYVIAEARDKILVTEKDKRIADLETKLTDLQQEQITEMQEHQDAMKLADKTIKELETKLAESEKKHLLDEKEWQDYCAFKHIEPQIKGCLDREIKYEKQIAEKDEKVNKQWLQIQADTEHIQRLQQQIAEKEVDLLALDTENYSFKQRIDNLREQLTEKDKENELMAKTLRMTKCIEKEINQAKIDYAVEQLEKVRKKFDCEGNYCYGYNCINIVIKNTDFNKYIDQLIAEIKGE
jgi:hypothetical protein